jgi:uncharacterized membrane protein
MTRVSNETRAAVRNIEEVVGLERKAARQRSLADRIADGIAGFVGTVTFVLLHLAWFAGWAMVNAGLVSFCRPSIPTRSSCSV